MKLLLLWETMSGDKAQDTINVDVKTLGELERPMIKEALNKKRNEDGGYDWDCLKTIEEVVKGLKRKVLNVGLYKVRVYSKPVTIALPNGKLETYKEWKVNVEEKNSNFALIEDLFFSNLLDGAKEDYRYVITKVGA